MKTIISGTDDFFTRNSFDVSADLNSLIRNKAFTSISYNNYTSYLDEDFGYQPNRKYLDFLSLHYAGFEFLNVPFSDEKKWKIFCCDCINLAIKDIPNLV